MSIIRLGESGVNIEIRGMNVNNIEKVKEIIHIGESISSYSIFVNLIISKIWLKYDV